MADISGKKVTSRTVRAAGFVKMNPATIELIKPDPEGNVFEVAHCRFSLRRKPPILYRCAIHLR